tara:strand:- start:303 stop:710 length:408 start_codon:yes stop_codon:yes gene_type:complete
MKLTVIKYHTHSNDNPDNKVGGRVINEKFLIGLANDACFTSNNGLKWKRDQISDALSDYDRAKKDENTYDMNRSENWLARLKPELEELMVRHDADKEVFKRLTGGETWMPKRPKDQPKKLSVITAEIDEIRKMVA